MSNVWATTSSSLFPSHRLKGNHPAVSGRAAAVESNEGWDIGDDAQDMDCSGIKEAGPQDTSDGKPSKEYMAQFAKAVDLYQQKEHRCFWCGSANHLICNCPKDPDGAAGVPLNSKEGMAKKGGQAPQRKLATQ